MTKFVQVEYTWKPTRCSHCCVFGHDDVNCRSIPREASNEKLNNELGVANDGFQKVKYRNGKNESYNNNNRRFENTKENTYTNKMNGYKQYNNKQNYRPKQNVTKNSRKVNNHQESQDLEKSCNNGEENGSCSKNGEKEKEVLQSKTSMDENSGNKNRD